MSEKNYSVPYASSAFRMRDQSDGREWKFANGNAAGRKKPRPLGTADAVFLTVPLRPCRGDELLTAPGCFWPPPGRSEVRGKQDGGRSARRFPTRQREERSQSNASWDTGWYGLAALRSLEPAIRSTRNKIRHAKRHGCRLFAISSKSFVGNHLRHDEAGTVGDYRFQVVEP